MSGHSLREVLERRGRLLARAEVERARLGEDFGALRGFVNWVDRGREAAAYLRAHPLAVAGAGVALVVVFRRPLFRGGWLRVIRRGLVAWRSVVALRALAARLGR